MQGSGVSSESIWTPFNSVCTATVRPLKARVLVSWNRAVHVTAYAVIGTSIVGGVDIIQGAGEAGINEADAFLYNDETERVLRVEYERHLVEPLGGAAIAMADVVLDNTDLRFTPNYNATIGTALKPNRPLKIFIGFQVLGQEKTIPIIEGLTLQPKEDKTKRTVSISAYDFMKFLNEKPQETAIYTNQRSDQIIQDVLSRAGVGSVNYALDQGLNTVGFAWFEKGDTAGERIRKIVEAEEGVFYQDEAGILRFETRDKYSQAPYNTHCWTIEPDDILEWEQLLNSEIINRVIVQGAPRSVKGEAEVWRDGKEEEVEASQTLTIWADFEDPVSSLTTPVANTDYKAYTGAGGTGSDITADVSINLTSFTKTAMLEITNNNAAKAYIYLLKLRGTPATVDYEIKEVYEDGDSVEEFNEHQKEIKNEFIDNEIFARSMAQNIVLRHKDPVGILRIKVRGVPQLQLRDQVRIKDNDLGTYSNYRIIGIQGVYEPGSFIQTLELREITENEAL
jgi:hypothetical protein